MKFSSKVVAYAALAFAGIALWALLYADMVGNTASNTWILWKYAEATSGRQLASFELHAPWYLQWVSKLPKDEMHQVMQAAALVKLVLFVAMAAAIATIAHVLSGNDLAARTPPKAD